MTSSVLERLHILFTTIVLFFVQDNMQAFRQKHGTETHAYVYFFFFVKKRTKMCYTQKSPHFQLSIQVLVNSTPHKSILAMKVTVLFQHVTCALLSSRKCDYFFSQAISNLTHCACFASVLWKIKVHEYVTCVCDCRKLTESLDFTKRVMKHPQHGTLESPAVFHSFSHTDLVTSWKMLSHGGRKSSMVYFLYEDVCKHINKINSFVGVTISTASRMSHALHRARHDL